VGEAYLARELFEAADGFPGIRVLATTGTRQGMEILAAEKRWVRAFFPFDRPSWMVRAVDQVRPRVAVLLETELWPGHLAALRARGAPVLLLNGRITERSLRGYRRMGGLWRSLRPDRVAAISPADARRFASLFGPAGVTVMPNIKFDRIRIPENSPDEIPPSTVNRAKVRPGLVLGNGGPGDSPENVEGEAKCNGVLENFAGLEPEGAAQKKEAGQESRRTIECQRLSNENLSLAVRSDWFKPEDAVVVLGSIREGEEGPILRMVQRIRESVPAVILALVPRHLHRVPAWTERLSGEGIPWELRSDLHRPALAGSIVVWDTFGELGRLYECADAVFVGGGLAPLGGQNFMEPLAAGRIPVIGPSWSNFAWIGEEIFRQGLAVRTGNPDGAATALLSLLRHPPNRDQVREKARMFVASRCGGARIAAEMVWSSLGMSCSFEGDFYGRD
jgi:3-deoxy-D-manno-octulosonic-acid transferase